MSQKNKKLQSQLQVKSLSKVTVNISDDYLPATYYLWEIRTDEEDFQTDEQFHKFLLDQTEGAIVNIFIAPSKLVAGGVLKAKLINPERVEKQPGLERGIAFAMKQSTFSIYINKNLNENKTLYLLSKNNDSAVTGQPLGQEFYLLSTRADKKDGTNDDWGNGYTAERISSNTILNEEGFPIDLNFFDVPVKPDNARYVKILEEAFTAQSQISIDTDVGEADYTILDSNYDTTTQEGRDWTIFPQIYPKTFGTSGVEFQVDSIGSYLFVKAFVEAWIEEDVVTKFRTGPNGGFELRILSNGANQNLNDSDFAPAIPNTNYVAIAPRVIFGQIVNSFRDSEEFYNFAAFEFLNVYNRGFIEFVISAISSNETNPWEESEALWLTDFQRGLPPQPGQQDAVCIFSESRPNELYYVLDTIGNIVDITPLFKSTQDNFLKGSFVWNNVNYQEKFPPELEEIDKEADIKQHSATDSDDRSFVLRMPISFLDLAKIIKIPVINFVSKRWLGAPSDDETLVPTPSAFENARIPQSVFLSKSNAAALSYPIDNVTILDLGSENGIKSFLKASYHGDYETITFFDNDGNPATGKDENNNDVTIQPIRYKGAASKSGLRQTLILINFV